MFSRGQGASSIRHKLREACRIRSPSCHSALTNATTSPDPLSTRSSEVHQPCSHSFVLLDETTISTCLRRSRLCPPAPPLGPVRDCAQGGCAGSVETLAVQCSTNLHVGSHYWIPRLEGGVPSRRRRWRKWTEWSLPAGADGSRCRLSAIHKCSLFVKVSVNHASTGVRLTSQ